MWWCFCTLLNKSRATAENIYIWGGCFSSAATNVDLSGPFSSFTSHQPAACMWADTNGGCTVLFLAMLGACLQWRQCPWCFWYRHPGWIFLRIAGKFGEILRKRVSKQRNMRIVCCCPYDAKMYFTTMLMQPKAWTRITNPEMCCLTINKRWTILWLQCIFLFFVYFPEKVWAHMNIQLKFSRFSQKYLSPL